MAVNLSRSLVAAGTLLVAVAGLAVPSQARADIVWGGSGANGNDPLGHAWLTQVPGFQNVTSWGIPGRSRGILPYRGTESITAVEVTFFGLPANVTLIPAGDSLGPAMNVTPFSAADLWDIRITGNTIVYTPPTADRTLDPGDSFFVFATFNAPVDLATFRFEAVYRTAVVPEPTSLALFGAGLAAVAACGVAGRRATWRRPVEIAQD